MSMGLAGSREWVSFCMSRHISHHKKNGIAGVLDE